LRLGILGGTFDPIHFGHLRIAEEMCEEMEMERVYLIPGALPPHKDRDPVTPFHDRLAMVRMAIQESSSLDVLDLEGRRKGLSYTIETLKEIHKLFKPKHELFFILGIDAFLEIKTWKTYRQLFDYAHFVVIKRPGFQSDALEPFVFSLDLEFQRDHSKDSYVSPSGHRIIYREATLMDISSSRIREMVSKGKTIRYLVPEAVRSYIKEKGLY
jgi:nicotinate-nucleotide adenylyltransferase